MAEVRLLRRENPDSQGVLRSDVREIWYFELGVGLSFTGTPPSCKGVWCSMPTLWTDPTHPQFTHSTTLG